MSRRATSWKWLISRRNLLASLLLIVLAVAIFRQSDIVLAYRLMAARQAIASRKFPRAIAILESSRDAGASSAQWHYTMACALRRAGVLDDVGAHLATAEQLRWNSTDIDRQRLLMRAQTGHIKEVESQLVELLARGGDDQVAEELYEGMARGYLAAHHAEDAFRCLKYWKEFQPSNPEIHLWTAELCRRMEKDEAAKAAFEEALRIDPDHLDATLKLAQLQLELANIREASDLFERCSRDPSRTAAAMLGLGKCSRRQGETSVAKDQLTEVLAQDATDEIVASALLELGQIGLEEDRLAPAIALLEQSVLLNPADAKSRLALAAAYVATDDGRSAEIHRDAAKKISADSLRLLSLTRRVATEPLSAELRVEIGNVLLGMRQTQTAIPWLLSAIDVDPNNAAANRALADYYGAIGDAERARRYSQAAGEERSGSSQAMPQDR